MQHSLFSNQKAVDIIVGNEDGKVITMVVKGLEKPYD